MDNTQKDITDDTIAFEIISGYKENKSVYNELRVLLARLIYKNSRLHEMLNSSDKETKELAIQLLFGKYIDVYNTLNGDAHYEWLLHEYPVKITYHTNSWYETIAYDTGINKSGLSFVL